MSLKIRKAMLLSKLNTANFDRINLALFNWMGEEFKKYYKLKKVPQKTQLLFKNRASDLISIGIKNGSIRTVQLNGKVQALGLLSPSNSPRVKGQMTLHVYANKKLTSTAQKNFDKIFNDLLKLSPKYTQISIWKEEEKLFIKSLKSNGFNTRYEILIGNTKTALNKLIQIKNPPKTLEHLGLEIKKINNEIELNKSLRLQKYVSLKSSQHGYFSHTAKQIKLDRAEYKRYLGGKNGLLLGVYNKNKLLGLMVAGIHYRNTAKDPIGGFSFFLHPSIQGKGIVKTGYLILLDFLVKKKVKSFAGGTSQPSISSLSKLMKRHVENLIYVKM